MIIEPGLVTAELAAAVAAERQWLARELHDGAIQSLWYLGSEIRRLQAQAATAPQSLSAELDALQATWARVYDELRQAVGDLHQPLPVELPLVCQLTDSLHRLEQAVGVQTELTVEHEPGVDSLDAALALQLARIAQCALANVQRHAAACHVRVTVQVGVDGVRLRVDDDGVGFDAACVAARSTTHYGLAMMRERAVALEGELTVTSRPGGGTCVDVWVPTPSRAPHERPGRAGPRDRRTASNRRPD